MKVALIVSSLDMLLLMIVHMIKGRIWHSWTGTDSLLMCIITTCLRSWSSIAPSLPLIILLGPGNIATYWKLVIAVSSLFLTSSQMMRTTCNIKYTTLLDECSNMLAVLGYWLLIWLLLEVLRGRMMEWVVDWFLLLMSIVSTRYWSYGSRCFMRLLLFRRSII